MRSVDGVALRKVARSMTMLCVPALVILGVLTMHSVVTSGSVDSPHTSAAVSATGSAHALVHHAAAADSGTDSDGSSLAAVCGDKAIACLAMLLGAGAYLVLRRAGGRRVVGMRLSPFHVAIGVPRPTLQHLTPLQRTAVLRC